MIDDGRVDHTKPHDLLTLRAKKTIPRMYR